MSLNFKADKAIHGHSMTAQRRLLLELLRDAEGHIDAKELYRRASARDAAK
jgi:Fe2+ or Zn2+ uptake regulation protein